MTLNDSNFYNFQTLDIDYAMLIQSSCTYQSFYYKNVEKIALPALIAVWRATGSISFLGFSIIRV